jgi:translation elongation factor EF-Ts
MCVDLIKRRIVHCLSKAETWLRNQAQAHGWEKATKLQGRATAQGLVSIIASHNNAVMTEINCETDFVARNKKFQTLVNRITQACYSVSGGQKESPSGLIVKVGIKMMMINRR